jgi:hypothetical protein
VKALSTSGSKYRRCSHPLADSGNPEWQQAFAHLGWQNRAAEVLSYDCVGQDVGDVIAQQFFIEDTLENEAAALLALV